MTHEIICLSNPYLALRSCGDVRNVFLLSHHETLHNGMTVRPSYQGGTGWRDIHASPPTVRRQSC